MTDYAKLWDEPLPQEQPDVPPATDYAKLWDMEVPPQPDNSIAQATLNAAATTDPDEEARKRQLAQQIKDTFGEDWSPLAINPELAQRRLDDHQRDAALAQSPVLSEFVQRPGVAAVVRDDIETLSRTEQLLTRGLDHVGAVGKGLVGQTAGTTLSGAGELYGVAARSLENMLSAVLPQPVVDVLRAPVLPWYLTPDQILKRPGEDLKALGESMGPPKERQTLSTDVAEGIGQLGGQIAAYLMTGGLASTGMMFTQGADIMAEKTERDAAAPWQRDAAVLTGGAITALTERYGLDKILNRVPPAVKNRTLRFLVDKVTAGGIEAGQEFAEGLLHDLTRRTLTNENAPIIEGVGREMSAAGLSAAIVRAALGVRGLRAAQQNEAFVRALGDDAKASKLRERLPDRYRKLIDEYTKDGPVQQVMIPAERFAEYFQTAGMDPVQVAQEAGATNFVEALAAGTDVVIPMGDFAAKLAPSDHLQGLMPDLRLAPGEMTLREAQEVEKNRDLLNQRMQEEIDRINEAAGGDQKLDAAIQRVIADAENQLAERYDPQTARSMATTLRGVAILAAKANPDADPLTAAESLWAKYGLTVDPLAKIDEEAGLGGQQFEQALASQPPRGWRHSTDGADAAAMWDGPKDVEAVFWTDLKGNLDQDVPAVAGYSHSIDRSTITHIRNNHGSAAAEARRGQLPVTAADVARIPEIVTGYDDIRTDLQTEQGAQRVAYAKRMDDGVLVFIEDVSRKRKDLRAVSLWKYPATFDAQTVLASALEHGAEKAEARETGLLGDALRSLSDYESDAQTPSPVDNLDPGAQEFNQAAFDGPELGNTPVGDLTEIDVDGVTRPALNNDGRPIHPTQEGIRNFWRWFADSKVVDEQGRPLVVYHGTGREFSEFKTTEHRWIEKGLDKQFPQEFQRRNGLSEFFYFTSSMDLAESYADQFDNGQVMGVYLKVENPLGGVDAGRDVTLDVLETTPDADGATFRDTDSAGRWSAMAWAVRSSTQVKSAAGNRGTFSPDSGNILYQSEMTPTAQAVQRWQAALSDKKKAPSLKTPAALRAVGVKHTEIEFSRGYIQKVIEKHDDVPQAVFLTLPALLSDPLMIYPYGDDGWRVIVNAETAKGEPIAVGVGEDGRIHTITPLHDNPSQTGVERAIEAFDRAGERRGVTRYSKGEAPATIATKGDSAGASLRAAPATIAMHRDSRNTRNVVTRAQLVKRHGSNFYQSSPQRTTTDFGKDKLGSLRIGPDRRMQISLFEKANLSTFLHEVGHFYLEVIGDLAEDPNTSQQVKDDYARILAFLGVASRAEITTEHHERWARANEAYLMEGKAPSPELRGVFQRFRAWLKLIYRELSRLNVDLTDEARGVLDRIYATDAEIERAEAEANLQELFLNADTAHMTEAEFAVYRDAVARQSAEARDELQTKLMRVERLKREAWWKEERAKVAEAVAAEFDATPAAQAFARLTLTGGDERMSRQQLVERYGEEILKRLPRGYGEGKGAVYAEAGQDIDSLAEVMGFQSADDLVQALSGMPRRARFIAEEAERRMMERHGDLLNDVAIADAAMEAIHNEQRETVLKIELRALNREIKSDMVPAESLRAIAQGLIGQKQVRDINPHVYLAAERKAAREAFAHMTEGGDRAEAFRAKQRELLNHYLYLEASRARAEADSIRKYLDGFSGRDARQRLAKAGKDYLAQIDALLGRYEFRKVALAEIDGREALAAWLALQEAEGNAVAVPLELQNEARRINWKQAPMDEIRALRDAVKNIAHLASLKNKLMRKRKALDFDKVIGELLGALQKNVTGDTGDLDRPSMHGAGIGERGAAAWRRFDAAHLKAEQLVEWLDGGDVAGPWARYFFDLAADAQTQEYDLHAEVTAKIEALSAGMPKPWRNSLLDSTTVRLPGFSRPMTRYDLISIALNMGNAQNLQRLQDGYGWSDADLQRVKDALTDEDMRYVQGLWDAIETLWPHMAALEERVSGLPPQKVTAQSLEVNGKVYRGGYFPLVYDPKRSSAGEKQAEAQESIQGFIAHGYGRPGTDRGATKQRQAKLKSPPLLDYEQVVTSHLSKVIKDVSHREAVLGMHKILTQPQIKAGMIERLGEARYTELRKWLQVLVSDRADTLHQAAWHGKFLVATRTNTAIVTMGFKITTTLAQFAGIGPVLDLVKPRFFTQALIQSALHPQETWQMIAAKSGEMRHRAATLDRDVRDALRRMRGEGGLAADVRRHAFILTAMADRAVSVPAWLGAYHQALAEGRGEEDAVRAGDRAVRLSQGAGGAKDLSAVQRNNELMKLITMFYTPFNVLYARLRDMGRQTAIEGIGYLPTAAARLLVLVAMPAVLGDLITGRGPDDDEDETWWAIRKILLYPLATVPVLRDFAGYIEAGIINATGEGEMRYRPEYKLSPVVGAFERLARTPGKAADAWSGEAPWDTMAWDIFEASGYATGLPTAQTRITGEYLVDLLSGDADPENAAELMRDAAFRRVDH